MAKEYSLETRIRRLIDSHAEAGNPARTLVMNYSTVYQLHQELGTFRGTYFWYPAESSLSDISFYRGIPVLIKEFVADGEVLVGI